MSMWAAKFTAHCEEGWPQPGAKLLQVCPGAMWMLGVEAGSFYLFLFNICIYIYTLVLHLHGLCKIFRKYSCLSTISACLVGSSQAVLLYKTKISSNYPLINQSASVFLPKRVTTFPSSFQRPRIFPMG